MLPQDLLFYVDPMGKRCADGYQQRKQGYPIRQRQTDPQENEQLPQVSRMTHMSIHSSLHQSVLRLNFNRVGEQLCQRIHRAEADP